MWIFSVMAVLMLVGTVICYFAIGYLPDMYIHVSAYGFILAGIGYIIELMKKREKNVEEHVEWIFDKKFKSFFEELKTIRIMILKLDERRERPDLIQPTVPVLKNEDRQVFSANQIPSPAHLNMKQEK